MSSEDWLLTKISTASRVVKSLDEATSARAFGACLLGMTAEFGVVSVIAGAIPRDLPSGFIGACGPESCWRQLPPGDAEAQTAQAPAFILDKRRAHSFMRDPATDEVSHWIVECARRRDAWTETQNGALFPVVESDSEAFGLGFFGPALSCGAAKSLAFIAYYAFARLLKIARMRATPNLSERHLATLRWAAEGKTDQEIAAILNVSGHTVDKYMRQIKQEMNAVNRTSAIVMAMRSGLIS